MPEPLVIFAPGSTIPVQETLRQGFTSLAPEITLQFHPPNHSGLLAQEIRRGAAADVFISANWHYIDELHQAGFVPQPEVLAGNRLVLLVRLEVASRVRGLADLAQPGIRVIVPPPEFDPLAQYIAAMFARAGLSDAIAEKRSRGEVIEDLTSMRDGFAAGEVDAAILYATFPPAFIAGTTPIALPPSLDMHDQIVFGVGAVVRDGTQHPAARPFVDFLIGPSGQTLLEQAGFLPRSQAPQR
jgi:molybdate transport system substrate-binding protein